MNLSSEVRKPPSELPNAIGWLMLTKQLLNSTLSVALEAARILRKSFLSQRSAPMPHEPEMAYRLLSMIRFE